MGTGPREEGGRGGVAGDGAVHQRDDPVGVAEAALQPMLAEDDGGPPLLVQPPQQPDELVARDRIELRRRLVEQHERRPSRDRRTERNALQLAAAQLGRRPVEQRLDAEREGDLLDAAGDSRRAEATVLEREGELAADGAEDDLRLGILEEGAGDRGDVARPVLAGVEPGDADGPGEVSAVEVGHEPARGAQQRRLAGRGQPGEHDELPRLDGQRDVTERGRLGPGVRVREAADVEDAHRSIPLRDANGSSATSTRPAASAHAPGPVATWISS